MNSSQFITDDGITILTSHPNATEFTGVGLHAQPVTDAGIALLADKMPKLRGMTLSETNITDLGVESIASPVGCVGVE